MHFVVLGPVGITVAGRSHSIPRAQTRGILALLLLNAGRGVSREAAIESVWAGAPPATAAAQIHNAVRDIRAHLAALGGSAGVRRDPSGYRIDLRPDQVDAHVFDRQTALAADAARRGDPHKAIALLRAALDLYAGDPLADASGAFVAPERARLADARLTAAEDLADLEIGYGRPECVAAELTALVGRYPLRERLRSRLMRALAASGRPAEALRVGRDYRRLLAEEEGLDPGPEITEAEATIRQGSGPRVTGTGPAVTSRR